MGYVKSLQIVASESWMHRILRLTNSSLLDNIVGGAKVEKIIHEVDLGRHQSGAEDIQNLHGQSASDITCIY